MTRNLHRTHLHGPAYDATACNTQRAQVRDCGGLVVITAVAKQ